MAKARLLNLGIHPILPSLPNGSFGLGIHARRKEEKSFECQHKITFSLHLFLNLAVHAELPQ